MRINKFLAQAGIASRRKIDQLIKEGKVIVNGRKAHLGQAINPQKDEIAVNGQKVKLPEKLEYIILNKPKGVTSTVLDRHAEKTVLDFVKSNSRLYPVGRLDRNSEGLILLTNDGELTNRLTHPKYHISKIYEVLFLGNVGNDKIHSIETGIRLEEGITKPAKVKIIERNDRRTLLEISLYEGRKRQLRRMAARLNLYILALRRIAIGSVKIDQLKPGESRYLKEKEINNLSKQ